MKEGVNKKRSSVNDPGTEVVQDMVGTLPYDLRTCQLLRIMGWMEEWKV